MRSKKTTVAVIIAIIMAFGVLTTVIYQVLADLQHRKNELAQREKENAHRDAVETYNWQRTVVRNILASANAPLSNDELHRRYLDEIQNVIYERRIPE